jgi:hypothetical protein
MRRMPALDAGTGAGAQDACRRQRASGGILGSGGRMFGTSQRSQILNVRF